MDLDNLKSQWQSLNEGCSTAMESLTLSKILSERNLLSAPQRIHKTYKRLFVVSLVWVPLSIGLSHRHIFPMWLGIVLAAYFALAAIINYYVMDHMSRIDLGHMTVIDALKSVCKVQRVRRILKVVMMSCCIPILIVMFMYFAHCSEAMFLGGVCGGMLGLVIGFITDIRIRRQLNDMKQALQEATES